MAEAEVEEISVGGTCSPTVILNKRFAKNILKQVDDHNRIKSDKESKQHREFENHERKKLTLRNLKTFSPQKTLYSDYVVGNSSGKKKGKINLITPLEQVQKIVSDAAKFDQATKAEEQTRIANYSRPLQKRSRITVDKTLLRNHLQHTSVHNRLIEEEEMWDQHLLKKKRKVLSLKSKSARERQSSLGGTMYSDREPSKVKPLRVKATPDEKPTAYCGEWTLKLLEAKEKDPDKWAHSGFKELYVGDLGAAQKKNADKRYTRKVTVSSSGDDDSSELSDADIREISKLQKVSKRVVKRIGTNNFSKNKERNKNHSEKVKTARSIIVNTLQNEKGDKVAKTVQIKENKTKILRRDVPVKRLHADQLEEEERMQRKTKPISSPKWKHDGFDTIRDIEYLSDQEEIPNKKIKSLAVVKPPSVGPDTVLNENDDWTEKSIEIDPKEKAKSIFVANSNEQTVWRRLWDEDTDINRVTLKNSIHHDEKAKKNGARVVLPETKRKMKEGEEYSSEENKQKGAKKKKGAKIRSILKKRVTSVTISSGSSSLTSSNESDSSFTESSSDECHKKSKKKKKRKHSKNVKHKATFSDYDSDFEPKH